jgi:hypothetical protein
VRPLRKRNFGISLAELSTRNIQVPADVEIEVVYIPPTIDGPRDALIEALAAFEKIKVRPIEFDHAKNIGQQASKLIAARS